MSPAETVASDSDTPTDRILDQGYRAYTGTRSGLGGAIRSVMFYSMRSSLGMGRPARHKILPWLAIIISLTPAVVIVGISIFLDIGETSDTDGFLGYYNYYSFIGTALFFFCGIVVPEILVADRRDGMLPLYMSTPLQRWSYLTAKTSAVMMTVSIMTVGPVLLLLLANTFEGSGPGSFPDWLITLVRIIGAGIVVALPFTAASMAASCLTDRRAIAAVGVIILFIASQAIAVALVEVAELSVNWTGLNLAAIPNELVYRIYGESGNYSGMSTQFVVLFNISWVAVSAVVVWWRYRRLTVSR